RLALLAVAATATGDVERNGNQVADFDELDVTARLDHLSRNFMAEDQTCRSGGTAADHVLVAAADISRDDLHDDAAIALSRADLQLGIIVGLYFHFSGAHIGYTAIGCHNRFSFAGFIKPKKQRSRQVPQRRRNL